MKSFSFSSHIKVNNGFLNNKKILQYAMIDKTIFTSLNKRKLTLYLIFFSPTFQEHNVVYISTVIPL